MPSRRWPLGPADAESKSGSEDRRLFSWPRPALLGHVISGCVIKFHVKFPLGLTRRLAAEAVSGFCFCILPGL